MDFKLKYLKYKKKYLELKDSLSKNINKINYNQNAGSAESLDNSLRTSYVIKLKELYPECKHDKKIVNLKDIDTTYGEMEYDGINTLNNKFNSSNDTINFLDIGSGRGKLVLWYGSVPGIKNSIGIEIVDERHEDAMKLKSDVEKLNNFSEYINKVNLIKSNIFDVNLQNLIQPGKTIVWFSNLCFNPDSNDKIFEKFINELPSKTIIICSQTCSNPKLQKIGDMNIPMSWSSSSTVYFYQTP